MMVRKAATTTANPLPPPVVVITMTARWWRRKKMRGCSVGLRQAQVRRVVAGCRRRVLADRPHGVWSWAGRKGACLRLLPGLLLRTGRWWR